MKVTETVMLPTVTFDAEFSGKRQEERQKFDVKEKKVTRMMRVDVREKVRNRADR